MTRLRWQEHNGSPGTTRRLSAQEALALHVTGVVVDGDVALARDVFGVVADERDMGTLIGWFLGDEGADVNGERSTRHWPPTLLGLPGSNSPSPLVSAR